MEMNGLILKSQHKIFDCVNYMDYNFNTMFSSISKTSWFFHHKNTYFVIFFRGCSMFLFSSCFFFCKFSGGFSSLKYHSEISLLNLSLKKSHFAISQISLQKYKISRKKMSSLSTKNGISNILISVVKNSLHGCMKYLYDNFWKSAWWKC